MRGEIILYICNIMGLKFIKPKEVTSIAKITIHKTGKMGFSRGASELLKLDINGYAKFGHNEENELFIVMEPNADEDTFNVSKAGAYYYISAKSLLDEIGVDYSKGDTIIYDIKRTEEENVYKLNKRVIKK